MGNLMGKSRVTSGNATSGNATSSDATTSDATTSDATSGDAKPSITIRFFETQPDMSAFPYTKNNRYNPFMYKSIHSINFYRTILLYNINSKRYEGVPIMQILHCERLMILALNNLEYESPLLYKHSIKFHSVITASQIVDRVNRYRELIENPYLVPTEDDMATFPYLILRQNSRKNDITMIKFIKYLLTLECVERNNLLDDIFKDGFDIDTVYGYFLFKERENYISLEAGCPAANGHIIRYLFDEIIMREVCQFLNER